MLIIIYSRSQTIPLRLDLDRYALVLIAFFTLSLKSAEYDNTQRNLQAEVYYEYFT